MGPLDYHQTKTQVSGLLIMTMMGATKSWCEQRLKYINVPFRYWLDLNGVNENSVRNVWNLRVIGSHARLNMGQPYI